MTRLMLRRVVLGVLCGGCSFVNSTTDLRDRDAHAPDGGLDASSDGSVDTSTSDTSTSDTSTLDTSTLDTSTLDTSTLDTSGDRLDAGCLAPPIAAFEVDTPTSPPRFAITFDTSPTCDTTIDVVMDAFTASIMVRVGEARATFIYTGPRVPVFDMDARVRTFVFGGTDSRPITMPVEQLQAVGGAMVLTEFSFSRNPSIDIANDGTVVFDSDDALLGSDPSGDIFMWQADGTATTRPTVTHVATSPTQLAAPKISDSGRTIAYIDSDTDEAVYISGVAVVRIPEEMVSAELHLDLRDNAVGQTFLLVHDEDQRNTIYDVSELTPGDPMTWMMGTTLSERPGLIYFSDGGGVGYASSNAMTNDVLLATPDGVLQSPAEPPCRMADDQTRVHASPMGRLSYVSACSGRRLVTAIGDVFVPVLSGSWGLVDARAMPDIYLLRNMVGRDVLDGYVLVSRAEGTARQRNLVLDVRGTAARTEVGSDFPGAAISPNGEWAAYTIVTEAGMMQVFRIPTRSEILP